MTDASGASIVVRTAEPDHHRFSHVLLRDRLYTELALSTRARLHFRVATMMLAQERPALAAAVHHLFEGQSAAPASRVAEVALAAAEPSTCRPRR